MRKTTNARKKLSTKTDSQVKKAARKSKRASGAKRSITKIVEQVMNLFGREPRDLVDAIKMDHDSLREFIKVLKDTDRPISERRRAFRFFSSLLKSHSVAEEQIVYKASTQLGDRELHIKVAEGYVEHQMCNDLLSRTEKTKVPLAWTAHANVIAEVLEHHLDEEERDLLPLVRKQMTGDGDQELLDLYVSKRAQTQKIKNSKNQGILGNRK